MAKSDNGELNNSNLASNNSDPNNSLLQKVTKRVSGLFPSSITKWFGPSDGSTSVIRRRDTEDDDEQLQIQQPPKKRAKPTASTDTEDFTTSNHFQMTSTPLMNTRIQAGPSNYTRHTIATVLYDADAPSTSTGGRGEPQILNGDDKSDDSGESTSGYSSVLVQQNKEPSFVSDRGHATNQPTSTMMMIMTSKDSTTPSPNKSLNTSRSLFSEQSLNPQRQCLSSRRPSFNSSTFGSPTFMDRTLSTRRAVNSPFYGGRTIYGGASAYKRNRIIFPRDEANNLQVKNSVNIKPVNDSSTSNENASLSKTARRILDTLEHFSTPVLDAKKIPQINRQKTQRVTPYARETQPVKPPNRELIIPTVPDLLKMKQKERLQNSTEQVRKLATTSKSVLNEYSIRTLEDETTKPQKHTTKIKAKIATVREKKNQLNDTVDAVQLPEIKLPITNLPKFDFTLPPPPKPKLTPPEKQNKFERKSTIIPSTTTKITTAAATTRLQNKIQVNEYKFAKPIVVKSDMPSIKAINHFKFSEPIDVKKPTTVKESTTPSFTFKSASNSTAPRKKDTKNNGQQNDVGFTLKPPEKLVEGSVMDILGKSDSIMDKFKPGLGTWECTSCMVRNIPTATRCVACETLKEPVKKSEPKPTTNISNFGNQFKMSAEKWECGVCMVRNNTTDVKCVACTTPKPQVKSSSVPQKPPASSFGGFGDKFKPKSDTWECDACMIRNKQEAVKCVACETPKPGTGKETSKPTLIMKIAPTPPSSGFSDFIQKQQTNWECPSCMVRNAPEKKTCVCCEAPKPGEKQEFSFGSSGTQFKFGIDKSSTTGSSNTTGFSFGVKATPTTTGSSTPSGFSFGVPKTESQDKTASTTTATPTFSFGMPVAATAAATTPTAVTTTPTVTTNNLLNGDPKKLFSFGTGNVATTTPAASTSTNNLLNGDPKKMFSFGTQSTTITSSTSSTTKPSTTTMFTPVVSLPKTIPPESNSTVSSTSPIPAVTITTTTTVAPSTTFSFGTTPAAKPNEEKKTSTPQLNFGSGSLPFNPVFGAASNVTKTTNSFVQPTANFLNTTSSESTPKTGFNTTFAFKPAATATTTTSTNNNKTEVKPFSFISTPTTAPKMDIPKGKFPEFTFNPLPATTTTAATPATPLSKAPVMNFANSNDTPKTPQNNMFSFGAPKTENKTPSFGGGSMFGQQQPPQTPQNGGFNFGATAVTPNFNFGATAATAPTTNSTTPVFGFGSSQAGSGSATAASTPGVFTFGGGPPATAAFTPDIKPNFNFTGGTSITSFTGQGGPSATMPQRKIRRAVRRTQPR